MPTTIFIYQPVRLTISMLTSSAVGAGCDLFSDLDIARSWKEAMSMLFSELDADCLVEPACVILV